MSERTAGASWTGDLIIVLTVAAGVLSISMGLRQSLGLFLEPMARGAGISAASFGLAMAVQNLAWGIGQPIMGAWADRRGGRVVVAASALLFAAGLGWMSVGDRVGVLVGGGLMIGFAVAGTSHGVLVGVISREATLATRPMAVAILAAAGSLGIFVIAPLAQIFIEHDGWRSSLLVLVVVALSMAGLAALLGGRATTGRANGSARADAISAIRIAWAHPGYVSMTVAFFACGFQLIFIAVHLPNYLGLCGLPPSVGAQALAVIGAGNALGTLVVGWLGERFGQRRVLASIYVLRTVAVAAFAWLPASVESTLAFAAAMGVLWLSVIPPVSSLITVLFGATNFGTIFGVMFLSHQLGAFAGVWLGGLSLELSGSYGFAWASLVAIGAAAALVQLRMDDRPRPAPSPT
ncbi:MAG: MFS transporter [Alphaproteobacteria bacterium]|nr:MFS transporter [Alphaproteobacteria bacterium]